MSSSDAQEVRVSGAGLKSGETGKHCEIRFTALPKYAEDFCFHLKKDLVCTFEGPKSPELIYDENSVGDDGKLEAYYVPLLPGNYKISIQYKGHDLAGSPFAVKIKGQPLSAEKLLSKVHVRGHGQSVGKVMDINEFWVDCSKIHPIFGLLTVHVKSPGHGSAHLDIVDHKNGTYQVLYKPIMPGIYIVDVKIAGDDIPDSPFEIRVMERRGSRSNY